MSLLLLLKYVFNFALIRETIYLETIVKSNDSFEFKNII